MCSPARQLLALALCLAFPAGCSEPEVAPNVLLVTLDTTRADALGAFGGRVGVTPNLDKLARESLVFREARTVAPMTLVAHSSMFTGLYPPRHTVRVNGPMFLPDSANTLAEQANDAGYQTAAFVSSLALDHDFGVGQGFEHYDQPGPDDQKSVHLRGLRADAKTTQRVLDWLKASPDGRPLFLWIHYFDPHGLYEPAEEFLKQGHGDPYLGEVAAMDAAFGELWAGWQTFNGSMRSLALVVGDHGEARMEHDEETHGFLCYDSTLRVPLLLQDSAEDYAGRQVRALTSVVDIYPTLLASMGLPSPDGIDGKRLQTIEQAGHAGVYFESNYGNYTYGWSPMAGWVDTQAKYIHSSQPELFSWPKDRDERQNLFSVGDERARSYRAEIAAVLAGSKLPTGAHTSVGEEAFEGLQALGYITSVVPRVEFPDPLESGDLPAPQANMGEAALCTKAWAALQSGRHEEAIAGLDAVLARNPSNTWAMDQLARALMETGQYPRAIEVLRTRLKKQPELITTHQRIAQCLQATEGELELIHKHLQRAMWLTAEANEARGQTAEAAKYRAMFEEAVRQSREGK